MGKSQFFSIGIVIEGTSSGFENSFLKKIREIKSFQYIVFQEDEQKEYNGIFCADNKRSQYYFKKFLESFGEADHTLFSKFQDELYLGLDDISLSELMFVYLNQNLDQAISLSFIYLLSACAYPISACVILRHAMLHHKNKAIEKVVRKFLFDFSDNHNILSFYYEENVSYLIKQSNDLYSKTDYMSAAIYLDKIVYKHNRKEYINKLGLSYIKSYQFDLAKELFRKEIAGDGDYTKIYLKGYAELISMNYTDALKDYSLAIKSHPFSIMNVILSLNDLFLKNFILVFFWGKITKDNIFSKRNISIKLIIEYVNLRIVRSDILLSLGRNGEAKQEALFISRWLRPDFFRAYENILLLDRNAFLGSKKRLRTLIKIYNKILVFFHRYGLWKDSEYKLKKYLQALYITLGRLDLLLVDLSQAEKTFIKAISVHEDVRAYEWLAFVKFCQSDYDECLLMYERVLDAKPNRLPVVLGIAKALMAKGENLHAKGFLEQYDGLMRLPKNKDKTHLVRRNLLYAMGDIKGAWHAFRDRKICDALFANKEINYIQNIAWDKIAVKNFLLLAEWGPGDELRWSSVYNELQGRFSNLTIGCDPRLQDLFTRSFPSIQFLPIEKRIRGRVTPENYASLNKVKNTILTQVLDSKGYEFAKGQDYVMLMSDLLGELRPNRESFMKVGQELLITRIDYDKEAVEWLESLPKMKLNIGICWKSGLVDASRSIHYSELQSWEHILQLPNINFINLQYSSYSEDIEKVKNSIHVDIYNPEIDLKNDFDRTSSLMKQLDLIISPATAVAELAGMLGVPTLLFTNSVEIDWRVKDDGYDLWHMSIKHIRADRTIGKIGAQKSIGDKIYEHLSLMIS